MDLTQKRVASRKVRTQSAPRRWRESCTHIECTLHQLAPYIGKIKSSIANELISRFSKPGDLIVDPFCGAGTIPLEAALLGRRSFSADISPYARVLSLAKTAPPSSLDVALRAAERAFTASSRLERPDLRSIPEWVRKFFHPETLREALQFADIVRRPGNEFLLACFLGILHHERPGFLSYPSSHLVPYLRDKKYPRSRFAEMYEYRDVRSRLFAKIRRSYKRFVKPRAYGVNFRQSSIQELTLPERFDALITSPPYMNALDYGRDNRLRLWFIDPRLTESVDYDVTQRRGAFIDAIRCLAIKLEKGLRRYGYSVFVIGEEVKRTFEAHPAEVVANIIKTESPSLKLRRVVSDRIPDVRRTRHECRGVKIEHILVFERI